jgi:ankyrin repeat protein
MNCITQSVFVADRACMFGADADVVSYLIRKFPGAAKRKDKIGMLPLHIACDSDIGIDSPNGAVIKILAEAYPDACFVNSEDGYSPLAISIARSAPLSVIETLIKACPESLRIVDQENQLPLHWAVAAKVNFETFRLLVVSYPSGLLTESNQKQTPYDYAVAVELDEAILDLLETP